MKFIKGLIVILLFIFNLPTITLAQETVRLTNGEWPPWLSKSLSHFGLASRIVTEAFALEGFKVEYGFFPWKRAYELARIGEWDGSILWSIKPEREAHFYYSNVVLSDEKVFFYLKNYKFDWKTIDDLKRVRIGATRGYTYGKEFDDAVRSMKIKVEYTSRDELNFRKLLYRRIDVFPCNHRAGYQLIQNIFKPEQAQLFTHHPKTIYAKPYHLILSKKGGERNKRLLNLFNKGLKRLEDSGKVDQYLAESQRRQYRK